MNMSIDELRARLRLAEANAQHPPRWALDTGGGIASLHVYGVIGGDWGDVAATDLVPAIRDLDVATLNVYINSPGGDVYDGIAIRNALRQHPAHVVVHIDGLAASAASFIACAGDEVVIAENAEIMIHDAWTIALGNAAEFRDVADSLDRISDKIAAMYAAKAGGDADEWRERMRAETWYSAREAVAAGLADRLDSDTAQADEPVAARFDLSMFAHAGRAAAPAPIPAAALAAPRKETTVNREQLQAALNAGIITQAQHDAEVAKLGTAPVAVLAAAPGVAVPAEYATGPQDAPRPVADVNDRPRSFAQVAAEAAVHVERQDMAGFVQTINNALTGVVESDDAGHGFIGRADWLGEVWQATPEGRPHIDAISTRPLVSTKIEGWKWTLPTPAPAPYAGGLAEIPTDEWKTEPVSETPDRWAFGNRVDRIIRDLGSGDMIASLFALLGKGYDGVSDAYVAAALQNGATQLAGGATSVLGAVAKSYLQMKKIGARPSKFWMSEDLFLGFSELKVNDLPAWLANATGFVRLDGNASLANVFDVDVDFELGVGGFLALDNRAATAFESPRIQLEAAVIANGAYDIGFFAYGGTLINDARAILKTTIASVYELEITGSPTGGTFKLAINGKESATIAHNADATAVQSALNAIDDGLSGITVTGTTTKTITLPVGSTLTANGAALTGGTAPAAVVTAV